MHGRFIPAVNARLVSCPLPRSVGEPALVMRGAADQGHNFGTADRIGERPSTGHGDSGTLRLARTPRGNTPVYRINHDEDALGSESAVQSVGNFFGQAFLQLRTRGEGLNHARQASEPHHSRIRNVREVRAAGERQKVVFTN